MRIALPVSEELDIGRTCKIGQLETFVIFLQLLSDNVVELEFAFVRRPSCAALGLELLQLIVINLEREEQ